MSAKNDITGGLIKSKTSSDAFNKGWDLIDWGIKQTDVTPIEEIQHGNNQQTLEVQGVSNEVQQGKHIP
jgi:hypothetical protein